MSTSLFLLSLLAFAALSPSVHATCQMGSSFSGVGSNANDDTICVPQGEGSWTFYMGVGLSTLGVPGLPDDPRYAIFG